MKEAISLLNKAMRGSRKYFFGGMALTLVVVITGFLTPLLVRMTIDNIIGDAPFSLPAPIMGFVESIGGRSTLAQNLWICAIAIVFVQAFGGVFQYLTGRWTATAAERTCESLRNSLYSHIAALPYGYHVKAETGDLVQRCTSDVDTVRRMLTGQLSQSLRAVGMLVFSIAIMSTMSIKLMFIAMALVPLILIFAIFFYKGVVRQFTLVDESEGVLTSTMQENLTGMRVVRAFGRQKFEMDKMDGRSRDFRDKVATLLEKMASYYGLSDFLCMLQIGIVVVSGAVMAVNGEISLGTMVSFIQFVSMLLWPVRQLGRLLSDIGRSRVSLKRIGEVLDTPAESLEDGDEKPPLDRDIVFDHVRFSYDDGSNALRDISFSAKAGQTIAVMGATGSGKSSLALLFQRIYNYQEGSITIGGVELRDINRAYLRAHVGIVLQEPFLYSRTLRENIAIVKPDMKQDEIQRLAETAQLASSVDGFEKGYDTVVGERGVTLSGGQKQRVAIARNLARDNRILIFDDSLSALDAKTDADLRKALYKSMHGVTTFIISHRVQSIQHADLILVLEEGRIVQQGNHEALLAQPGIYREIFNLQTGLAEGGDSDAV